jgi:hypothetical protein
MLFLALMKFHDILKRLHVFGSLMRFRYDFILRFTGQLSEI